MCLEQCRRLGKGVVEQAAVMFVPSLAERQNDWVYLHTLELAHVRSVLHSRVPPPLKRRAAQGSVSLVPLKAQSH